MRIRAILLSAALILTASSAFADTFTFSFAGDDTGSGTITATPTSTAGQFTITDITGKMNKASITGLITAGTYPPNGFFQNDNLLFYPASNNTGLGKSYLDQDGVAFTLSNGNKVNVYYSGGYFIAKGANGNNLDSLTSFNVAAVPTPEPSSLALLGTGVLGVLGGVRRRFAA